MNFYDVACTEPPIDLELFGICDDKNAERAYTDTGKPENWIAKVENKKKYTLTFTAIDKCVIKDKEEEGRGRCDGMITSDDHIFFIELKDEKKDWIQDAISQLESTITFFKDHHDIEIFKYKKAYACNKRKKIFKVIDNEENLRFFRKHKVRLDVQAEIIVV
ncbi:hypothetical protein [Plebeiibacterium marinum]|uniref:Uncharacterized protein n=1 Tax=Plebeiibacterium marinum TaxID=2992111 RepID=A0AAE3SI67_9BACT|nr:hypothetical protein [Plebeiobacterium marinum]MCW3804410.1 hypothetical protein [Plebeiobacterium marinum]